MKSGLRTGSEPWRRTRTKEGSPRISKPSALLMRLCYKQNRCSHVCVGVPLQPPRVLWSLQLHGNDRVHQDDESHASSVSRLRQRQRRRQSVSSRRGPPPGAWASSRRGQPSRVPSLSYEFGSTFALGLPLSGFFEQSMLSPCCCHLKCRWCPINDGLLCGQAGVVSNKFYIASPKNSPHYGEVQIEGHCQCHLFF